MLTGNIGTLRFLIIAYKMHVVWFKKDCRIHDHQPLAIAANKGPVLPLYVVEPELWQQPDMSHRHYAFLGECIRSLDDALTGLGQPLIIRIGEMLDVLTQLKAQTTFTDLWSHQETGNYWTYQRDIAVSKWCKRHDVTWHEIQNNGVVRRLPHRDGWSRAWHYHMAQPPFLAPMSLTPLELCSEPWPEANTLGLSSDGCTQPQTGGREAALTTLDSFFAGRGKGYSRQMSSPVTAYDACSRLSPYLTFGCLSMREVYRAVNEHKGMQGWGNSIRALSGRLRWHCHFIQKLEDQPDMEWANLHSAYNAVRQDTDFNEEYFQAWCTGNTGYPMVDACMRALIATGWINFRMRAMLMSFASYHLWLHWRRPALHLAKLFVDYEPGIHYSQCQMQSGTTGMNTLRMYNPIKQGQDHDPEGIFVRQWLPELLYMPAEHIHTPWHCPEYLNGYPMPIVDEATARKQAASQLYALRKDNGFKQETAQLVQKHGSRKKTTSRKPRKPRTQPPSPQLDLPL